MIMYVFFIIILSVLSKYSVFCVIILEGRGGDFEKL